MKFSDNFKTRWTEIPRVGEGYRLLCSNPLCSLSCANLKNGKISVTSIHGDERHSYELTKNDMLFATITFLNHLTKKELETFTKVFNKISPEMVLILEQLKED